MSRSRRPDATPWLLLIIAYLGFISLGLPDTLIGVAWPSARETFAVSQSAIALIFFGAGASYFLSGIFAGRFMSSMGVGLLLAASSGLVAFSMLGYAAAPVWGLFAACSLLHGLGSGAIDAGLNYYAAHHFTVRHMNWLHACWSFGATLGPLIMTAAVTRGQFRMGYGAVAVILALLALLFLVTRRRWAEPASQEFEAATATPVGEPAPLAAATVADAQESGRTGAAPSRVSVANAIRHPVVWIQVVLFFFYTGLEATVGQWSFTLLTESRGVGAEPAGVWVTIYWASIGVGRVLLGTVADRIGIDRLVRLSTVAGVLGTGLYAAQISPAVSAVALLVIGLGLASIYPCMMTRTPQRLGSGLAAHAIGFQVSAATLGAAALPSLAGVLAEAWGLETLAYAAVGMALIVWVLHERLLRASTA